MEPVFNKEDMEPEKEKQSSKSGHEDENDNIVILGFHDLDDTCSDINDDGRLEPKIERKQT